MIRHTHDIDGALHEGCPMCNEIRARHPHAMRERKADEAAERYRKIAERTAPDYCNVRWLAPRVDVPSSIDVEHVCQLPLGHLDNPVGVDLVHVCSCGAFIEHDARPRVNL